MVLAERMAGVTQVNERTAASGQTEIEAALRPAGASARKKALRYAVLAVVLVAAAFGGWRYFGAGAQDATARSFVTEPAAPGDITVKVTATGAVQPTTQVDVSSEMSGIVRRVLVDFNSQVKVGDVLAELDNVKVQAAVDSARARLSVSLAQLHDAEVAAAEKKLALERKEHLAKRSITPEFEREAAKAAYDRSIAQVTSARASVDMAAADLRLQQTSLERARILSPINGVVLMRRVDPGQTVASSLQAPVLFTIAEDLTRMEVQVNVDEADVGRVGEGQPATFTVDAYPQRTFEAVVRAVRYGSEVVQGVVTYKAILATDNADMQLRPGMTATAEITVTTAEGVLTIPNRALRFTPPRQEQAGPGLLQSILPGRPQFRPASGPPPTGPQRRIYVLREGELTPVRVVVGVTDGQRTQVVKGQLREGDAVVIDVAGAGAGRARGTGGGGSGRGSQ